MEISDIDKRRISAKALGSRKKIIVMAEVMLSLFLMGGGMLKARDSPPENLYRLGVQADILSLSNPDQNGMIWSGFLAFEMRLTKKSSLRFGISPPQIGDRGHAYALNLSFATWHGRRPNYFESAVGIYYQNTQCNAWPNFKWYTLYLGWRHQKTVRTVYRLGVLMGLTPKGKVSVGFGLGFGRSTDRKTS